MNNFKTIAMTNLKEINYEKVFFFSILVALLMLVPDFAFAEAWDSTAKKVQDILGGNLFRTIATIAIMVVGYMAFTGRINWKWAGSIIGGIVLIVAAPKIVELISSAAGGA